MLPSDFSSEITFICKCTASDHYLLRDGQNLTLLTRPILTPRVPQNGSNIEVCQNWMLSSTFSSEITFICKFTASDHYLLGDGQNLTLLIPILTPRVPQNGSNMEVCQNWMLPSNTSSEITFMCKFTASDHHLLGDGHVLTPFDPHIDP